MTKFNHTQFVLACMYLSTPGLDLFQVELNSCALIKGAFLLGKQVRQDVYNSASMALDTIPRTCPRAQRMYEQYRRQVNKNGRLN